MANTSTRLSVKDRYLVALIFLLGAFLTFHFALIVGFNLPESPLTHPFRRMLIRYTVPFFQQRWTFFAPKPPTQTLTVVARAQGTNLETKQSTTTDWIDVSGPLWEQEQKTRLTPLSLVQLGLSNASIQFMNDIGERARNSAKSDFKKEISEPLPASIDPLDAMAMTRTAESSLAIQFPNLELRKIQVGIAIHDVPKYENRFSADNPKNVAFLSLEWTDAQHVVPFCCQGGR